MEQLVEILVEWGPTGMFVAAFLAGSFFPFSSEVVMLALLATGASPTSLLLWGTAGNVLGSLFNYYVGSLGREEWITRWTKVPPDKLERGKAYVRRYGAWAGLLGWVPLLGSVITVALGFLRVNVVAAISTIAVGKFVRYWVLVEAWRITAVASLP